MKAETAKAELKRLTDEAIRGSVSHVEATLEPGEYNIYTEVWAISMRELDKIRSKVTISNIYVDGGRIMLVAKI